MSDGSYASIVEDDFVPKDKPEGNISVQHKKFHELDVYEVESMSNKRAKINQVHVMDGKGHKIIFSGLQSLKLQDLLTNCTN